MGLNSGWSFRFCTKKRVSGWYELTNKDSYPLKWDGRGKTYANNNIKGASIVDPSCYFYKKVRSNITVWVYFFLSFSNFLLIFYFSTYAPQPNVQYWPFQPLTFPSSTSWLVSDLRLRWRKGLPKIFANFVHVLYRKAYN